MKGTKARKRFFSTFVSLILCLSFGLAVVIPSALAAPSERAKTLIGFKEPPGPAEQALIRGEGGTIKYTYRYIPVIAAALPEQAIDALRRNPKVLYVESDFEVEAIEQTLPWGVDRVGADMVWPTGNRGSTVKVAILDTGIDYNHPDLDANYKGGYDYVNDDGYPMDDHGHGTHVAGIIAAEDNDIGVVGVAPEADLSAVKVLNSRASGYLSDVIAGIEWSTDNGMQIVNMSLGTKWYSYSLQTACDNAYYDYNIVLVAAAGNSGNPEGTGDSVLYPAANESVVAVAATDMSNERAPWSSSGPQVELAAPGAGIYSTYWDDTYATKSGTSMACPHAAGVAALVIASGITGAPAVRDRLDSTAQDLGNSGRDNLYGYGLVDAEAAVGAPPDTTPPAKVIGLMVSVVSETQLDLLWDANTESDLDHYNVYRSTASGQGYNLVASPTTNSYSDTGLTPSTTYYYRVSAVDTSGNEGERSDEASETTMADTTGPVTSDVAVSPNPTNGATSVTLTANVDDSTTGKSSIAAAEYFVNTVGDDGSGTAMSASDGVFDSATEGVTSNIDISGWAPGDYTLYVHGQDSAGFWGEVESVVLSVTEASSNTMHVKSIDMRLEVEKRGKNTFVYAVATVTIVGSGDNPVEGATVDGHWEGATKDSDSGVTGTDGTIELESHKVKNPSNGTTFTFVVDTVTKDGWTYDSTANVETSDSIMWPSSSSALGIPTESRLFQNYPNPFNPETTIEYSLAESCNVTLKIYNVAGQLIKTLINEYQQAGSHRITWYGDSNAGGEVASGVYFYRIKAGDFVSTKKMIVLK